MPLTVYGTELMESCILPQNQALNMHLRIQSVESSLQCKKRIFVTKDKARNIRSGKFVGYPPTVVGYFQEMT